VAGFIISGDAVTGVTVIEMTSKMDAGPIVAQREIAVSGDENTESLTERLSPANAQLLHECLLGWLDGSIQAFPQDESRATYSRLLTKEMGVVDWSKSADVLAREVRAFNPWPVSHSLWPGGVIRIFAADAVPDDRPGAEPGQVVALESNGIAVETGHGLLTLRVVQAQGGRRMAAAEFVRGHPSIRHAIFGS